MSIADQLRDMHADPPLVLPNVWDAASARSFAKAGARALATSSSAVAHTLGHSDGEDMPRDEAFAAVARIARAVDVPVTADIEAGYGLTGADLAARLIDAGAAGCNLEDTDHSTGALVPLDMQVERIAELVGAAQGNLVVNARIDVHLRSVGPPEQRIDLSLERAVAYLEAGADCTYPIGAPDEETIAALVKATPGPVNALCRPGGPTLARLVEIGATRITFGGSLHRAVMRTVDDLAARIASGGEP
jgi:2-methylisocitrate lyase-like PEP mutase family enzyme